MQEFRLVKAEDPETLRACLQVREQVFTVEKGVPGSIEADGHDLPGDTVCDHFLMCRQGTAAGALRCLRLPDETVQVQRFCVLAQQRGTGLGRLALEALEHHYRALGKTALMLDAKFEVQGFYLRCGYRAVSEVFEEAGIPHIKMEKRL